MSTTKHEIKGWFDRGVRQGYRFMLVVVDTFDYGDYPVYTRTAAEALEKRKRPGEMQRVMEVYDLTEDRDLQLEESRAWASLEYRS